MGGGRRALWGCYSAALVRSAGRILYGCRKGRRELSTVICLYGKSDKALWNDYQDCKCSSILLNEELRAADGCADWKEGVVVVVHLIIPRDEVLTLNLRKEERAPRDWHQGSVLHKIMVDVAKLCQASRLCSEVRVVLSQNHETNLSNYTACRAQAKSVGASTKQWYLHPAKNLPPWVPVPILSDDDSSEYREITRSVSLHNHKGFRLRLPPRVIRVGIAAFGIFIICPALCVVGYLVWTYYIQEVFAILFCLLALVLHYNLLNS